MSEPEYCYHEIQSTLRDASKHENNHLLDREIQLQMLEVDEDERDKALVAAFNNQTTSKNQSTQSSNQPTMPSSGNSSSKQKSAQPVSSSSRQEDFCAWCPNGTVKLRKLDKASKTQQKEREYHVWRDYRPKEINFVFKHYPDWQRYIEQYRYEHTYNFGPLSKEMIDIHQVGSITDNITTLTNRQKRPPPRLRSEGNLQSLSNPGSSSVTPRTQSESNILELATKYKLTSTASPPLERTELGPIITQPGSNRSGSAKSRSNSASSSRSKLNGNANKVPSIPRGRQGSPVPGGGASKQSSNSYLDLTNQ